MPVSEPDRPWVRPSNLIAGGVLAVGGPAIAVAGGLSLALGGVLALPLFAVGVVAARALIKPKPVAPPPKVDMAADLAAGLAQLEHDIADKVPPMVLARVERVAKTVRETLPRLDQLGPGSQQAHSVVQTAASYLPEAVGAYMRLPRSFADRRPVSGGKTSLMVLCDQLDLLGNKMDEIFDAVCRADADALIAHGRFLADKFGSGALALGQQP